MNILFVTSNQHKIREVSKILPSDFNILGLEDIDHKDEIPETQDTIEGNSRQKAEYIWDGHKIPCFAEDTGLIVPSLGGAPGIYSARYAGPEKSAEANMLKLLKELESVKEREAYFKTVVTWIDEKGERQFTGELHGQIGYERAGTGGFGYDPIFLLDNSKTLAEIGDIEKNKISHRALAVNQLVFYLKVNYL